MEISVPLTTSGYLPDLYSKYAPITAQIGGYPVVSPPIDLRDVPEETVSLALTLLDYDAVPVGGFVWIHWLAANLAPDLRQIPENISQTRAENLVQGRNSTAGRLVAETDPRINQRYTGPQPPDQDHHYELTVYALRQPLALRPGYWFNEFRQLAQPQIITTARTIILSRV
ncbi:YbhB/YbcL family Raf kinase inhibitor-like protein [Lapidilactobacillus luobeiensis]|uniref:YbhB/YbcL family Raf kinase inhibitor-like protein n=1 Tax=Lapidilactobacillus luobeiensis TaxID=2950371 RepID=UPI0021C3F569|nr:YbhB/YbcL family Raf kinase inhibitor-like protein [Lapidilactobacillus luobeiensis]